jgi:hypothetical protein
MRSSDAPAYVPAYLIATRPLCPPYERAQQPRCSLQCEGNDENRNA